MVKRGRASLFRKKTAPPPNASAPTPTSKPPRPRPSAFQLGAEDSSDYVTTDDEDAPLPPCSSPMVPPTPTRTTVSAPLRELPYSQPPYLSSRTFPPSQTQPQNPVQTSASEPLERQHKYKLPLRLRSAKTPQGYHYQYVEFPCIPKVIVRGFAVGEPIIPPIFPERKYPPPPNAAYRPGTLGFLLNNYYDGENSDEESISSNRGMRGSSIASSHSDKSIIGEEELSNLKLEDFPLTPTNGPIGLNRAKSRTLHAEEVLREGRAKRCDKERKNMSLSGLPWENGSDFITEEEKGKLDRFEKGMCRRCNKFHIPYAGGLLETLVARDLCGNFLPAWIPNHFVGSSLRCYGALIEEMVLMIKTPPAEVSLRFPDLVAREENRWLEELSGEDEELLAMRKEQLRTWASNLLLLHDGTEFPEIINILISRIPNADILDLKYFPMGKPMETVKEDSDDEGEHRCDQAGHNETLMDEMNDVEFKRESGEKEGEKGENLPLPSPIDSLKGILGEAPLSPRSVLSFSSGNELKMG